MTDEIKKLVNEVNTLLFAGEPHNVSVDTYSHYSGYKPQYIIDAMNEVFSIGTWGFKEISNEVVSTQGDKGTSTLTIAQVEVWMKDVPFHPTGWGQARVTKGDIGDARKGAQTDALKKALSYFSIGNRAYQGLLPDSVPTGNTTPQPTNRSTQRTQPTNTLSTVNKTTQVAENKKDEAKLENIPSASALRKEIAALKIIHPTSKQPMTWEDALAYVYRASIANKRITLQELVKQGDELGPNLCVPIAQFVQQVKTGRTTSQSNHEKEVA